MTVRPAAEARPKNPPQSDETLDCTGLICPLPIYKTSRVLERLAPGRILKVVCTDPGSLEDFPAFSRRTGHRLEAVEASGGTQTFWLRRS